MSSGPVPYPCCGVNGRPATSRGGGDGAEIVRVDPETAAFARPDVDGWQSPRDNQSPDRASIHLEFSRKRRLVRGKARRTKPPPRKSGLRWTLASMRTSSVLPSRFCPRPVPWARMSVTSNDNNERVLECFSTSLERVTVYDRVSRCARTSVMVSCDQTWAAILDRANARRLVGSRPRRSRQVAGASLTLRGASCSKSTCRG